MYGQGPVYNEQYAEAVARKQEALLQKSYDIGTKMKRIFWVTIISVVMTALLSLQLGLVTLGYQIFDEGVGAFMMVASGLIIACSVVYALSLISLKCYNDSFSTAGILYMVSQALSVVKNYSDNNTLNMILSVSAIALQILQMRTFVDATASSLREIDRGLELSWRSFWDIYVKLLYATIIMSIVTMIPFIFLLGVIVLLVLGLAALIMNVWMLSLIWRTGSVMTRIVKLN